ncbi:unnamed protein product [Prunus armeniaca]|uniref:Uncharacterized protein n=1 Tax=Prunus armeniaca TaxID=36596 RepID=A0A6J5TEN0_PRUAR|nr:unnamed protein product [Prunus armeniaca]
MKTTCWELSARACKEGKTHRATENRQPTHAMYFFFFCYNCSLSIQIEMDIWDLIPVSYFKFSVPLALW